MGRDPWNFYGISNIVGWAFNSNNAEDWLLGWGSAGANHYGMTQRGVRLSRAAGFYPGFGDMGISAEIKPMDNLTVIVALPWMNDNGDLVDGGHNWAEGFMRTHVSARYSVAPVSGTVALSWIGGPGDLGWGPDNTQINTSPNIGANGAPRQDSSKFFLSFHSAMLKAQGIEFIAGLAYTLPYKLLGAEGDPANGIPNDPDITTHFPLEAGIGFLYTQGNLRVPVRMAATFGGSVDGEKIPVQFGLNINPRYDLGFMYVHLAAGIQVQGAGDENSPGAFADTDAAFGWHITPHIVKEIVGPMRLYAGFHAESNGVKNADDKYDVEWRVPIGIQLEW